VDSPPELAALKPVAHLQLKAALLLLCTLALVLGAALYLLHARGVFEPVQRLVLIADDSEGVSVGMDMTFSGIPIGRVQRIELAPNGNARILIDVPRKDAHWLRESSVFTLVRGLVGGTTIKAYSGILDDPPLFHDLATEAERSVLRGDATAELPQVLALAREILANVERLTAQDAALSGTLADLHALTQRMRGPHGVLGALIGNAQDAGKITRLLGSTEAIMQRSEGLLARAERQMFDADAGLVAQLHASVAQTTQEVSALLHDTRASLAQINAVLAEAQAVGANARAATQDLDALRAEVEGNLRRLEDMLGNLQGKWPFARPPDLKLP